MRTYSPVWNSENMLHNKDSNSKKYKFNNDSHYIVTNKELSIGELQQLGKLLDSFPHSSKTQSWPNKFLTLHTENFSEELIFLAANAYDTCGNTMLGVAAEYGKSVEAVQKLIDMGANLDTPDHNMKKLALHWAINNKSSCFNKISYDAVGVVKCLLDNGAKTNIICYDDSTPLKYAQSRGFVAAADLIEKSIEESKKNVPSLYQLSFFKLKNMLRDEVITKSDIRDALPADVDMPESFNRFIKC